MAYFLVAALVAVALAFLWLYLKMDFHRHQATVFTNLFYEAQQQLGKVHDALSDIPKDASTEISTVILRYKFNCLSERNQLWELQKLLEQCEPSANNDEKAIDKLARVLAAKANAESELNLIDNLLRGRQALDCKNSRYDKIAYSLAINQQAASGQKVSNK